MALIVGGSPLGFLSGKMGGMVFSHNKGGQYVKQYVVPVDRNSDGQINARLAFSQAVSAFHALTPPEKSAWNVFAASYFNSRSSGNVPGLHSGVNAFVALRTVLLNSASKAADVANTTISINGTPATVLSLAPITINSQAPTTPMIAVLNSGSYSIIPGIVATYDVSTNVATVTFNVGWNTGPTYPTPTAQTTSILNDLNANPVGFKLTVSEMLVQAGVSVINPDLIQIGDTGLIDAYTSASVVTNQVEIEFDGLADPADFVNWPVSLGTYQFGLWMYNTQGQMIKIGSVNTQIP
jgi:hypothetical protein